MLEVSHLSVEIPWGRGHTRVLVRDASLSLREGEALGLVGESGSGKSVTSRAIHGLLPQGARLGGGVKFDGEPLDISMIFQNPRAHINPVRTVGDFMTEALRTVHRVPRTEAEDRIVAALAEIGVQDGRERVDRHPHQMSGGLLQRMMIAAALATGPKLLLADEPTTALDVTTQQEVMAILDEQRRARGMALLLVTHDLELAAAVCDRIVVMYAGTIVEDRPAATLHAEHRHPYTAGLLASRPSLTARGTRLPVIPGTPSAAYEVGDGCAFADRCALAIDRCRTERPQPRGFGGGLVACHRAEETRPATAVPEEVGS